MLKSAIERVCRRTSVAKFSSNNGVPKEKADAVVIGAGVVGLAIARELSIQGRDVLVLDSSSTFGSATSSRNSEVLHAGIYYPPNSLKATFCVRGRQLLYKYCSDHGIPHKQTCKLIVATSPSEVPKLNDIMNRGIGNGVRGLRMMGGVEAMRMEPELQCVKALFSPLTGIVDSHSLMLSLVGEAESHGATFSYNTTVVGGHIEGDRVHLHVCGSKDLENQNGSSPLHPELIIVPELVVNSAGLGAPALANRLRGLNSQDGGIGVHVTLDLNGQVKFGPDVEWIGGVDDISTFLNKFDYSVCGNRVERFYPEIRKYYPNLKDGALEAGYAGIRPKLSGPRQTPVDFVVQGQDVHGIAGLVNLFGIESPGLTSSLAIAEDVGKSPIDGLVLSGTILGDNNVRFDVPDVEEQPPSNPGRRGSGEEEAAAAGQGLDVGCLEHVGHLLDHGNVVVGELQGEVEGLPHLLSGLPGGVCETVQAGFLEGQGGAQPDVQVLQVPINLARLVVLHLVYAFCQITDLA